MSTVSRTEIIGFFAYRANDGVGVKKMEDVHNFVKVLTAETIQTALDAELESELGYSKYDYKNKETDNSRNGYSRKTVQGSLGELEISVPRDRKGEYEPQLVKKHQTDVSSIEDKVLFLYSQGVSTRDIQSLSYHDPIFFVQFSVAHPLEHIAKISDNPNECVVHVTTVLDSLLFSPNAIEFEGALAEIGKMLGFESSRLDKEGGPDNLWAIGNSKSRPTVIAVLRRAGVQGLDWQTAESLSDRELAARLLPASAGKHPYKMPDYDYIHRELAKPGMTQQLLWFEYCETCRAAGEIPYQLTQFKTH